MTDTPAKKLLILEGPNVPAELVEKSMEGRLAIERVAPENARAAIQSDGVAAVLADMGAFLPLARELADWQANALLAAVGEGLCLADGEGTLVWANKRFESYDDATRDAIGRACRDTVRWFNRKRDNRGPDRLTSRKHHVSSAGGDRTYEVVVSAFTIDGKTIEGGDVELGDVDRVVAIVWDVTTSSRIHAKIDAIDRAGAELVRLEVDHVRKLNNAERLRILQEKVIRSAHQLLNFDNITIHLLDEETGRLELVMYHGLPKEVEDIDLYAAREGSGTTGFVASTGRSYICFDTSKDDKYIEGLEHAGSSLTVPLLISDKVIGVFNAESGEIGAFSEDDKQFAEIFARYIALALHILDLLVVERYTTGETVSGVVAGELNEPLDDLVHEAEWLQAFGASNPDAASHAARILRDVDSIRSRMKLVARGPRSILGAEQAMRSAEPDPALVDKRILVADDEPGIRNTIRDVLQRRGAIVFTCQSGAEAIDLLERAGDGDPDAPRIDLVLSDIKMPDRNGYEVFSAARRLDEGRPVMLMTGFGYDPHHSIVRASQEGLHCVLFKPFQARQLLEQVRSALIQRANSGQG